MAAEGLEDLSNNGEKLTNPPELYEPEVADLPKPDVVESVESSADEGDTGVSTTPYTAEGVEEEEGEMPTDFERLWKHTSDNPQDFNSWTDLLQYCEQEGHMRASRQALNAFLVRYPLCYGYWKKFADLERQAGHNDKAEEVCERGLKAIPLSVDLWIHYINILLGTFNMNLPESTQRIRSNIRFRLKFCCHVTSTSRETDAGEKQEAGDEVSG